MTQIAVRSFEKFSMLKVALATIFICVVVDEISSETPNEPMTPMTEYSFYIY